jgi:cell division protease FtsH
MKNIAIYALIVLMVLLVVRMTDKPSNEPKNIEYSQFKQDVADEKVQQVAFEVGSPVNKITVDYKNGTQAVTNGLREDDTLLVLLNEKAVNYTVEPQPGTPWWLSLLGTMLPVVLLMLFFMFMINQTQGGGSRVMQFGKSRARLSGGDTRVTFKDVAGAEEAKEEMTEVVEFLKSPQKFVKIGAKIPKGVLLFGAPGTGKTLLAKAVAGEAGVPFFTISGSDFVEMFVGVGASRVRDLFEQAKKSAPCIVFIDEIDAVGRHRGAGLGGGHDEREQTLNQLLVEMDGFSTNEGIIVMASTNRPDILDPALLRPGRFDRHIMIDRPDVKGREAILQVHVKEKPLAPDVKLDILAKRTPGFTGADLANLVNEAALLTARRDKHEVGMQEMEESVERVLAGPEKKSRVISESEKKLVAYHEAGHAIVSHVLPHTDKLHKISIIPRGRAGGYTLLLPEEDRNYLTKSHMLDEIATLLGGRVSEALILNDISTGAQNDLERASSIVRRMIMEYGMSDELGPLTYGHKTEEVFLGRDISRERNYSDAIAYAIDKEAGQIIDENYKKAEDILRANLDKLHQVAKRLMEVETIDAEEFNDIMQGIIADTSAESNPDAAATPEAQETPGSGAPVVLEEVATGQAIDVTIADDGLSDDDR